MKKFFILIANLDAEYGDLTESETSARFVEHEMERDIKGYRSRSKAYDTREIAEAKAKEYIEQGRGKKYFIMECVAMVRKMPPPMEVVEIK